MGIATVVVAITEVMGIAITITVITGAIVIAMALIAITVISMEIPKLLYKAHLTTMGKLHFVC